MADSFFEILKVLVPVIVGAACGYWFKVADMNYQRRREKEDRRDAQRQSRWSPLLEAARELRARLERLARVYRGEKDGLFTAGSFAGDFRELYTLSPQEKDWQNRDPDAPRKDKDAVQRLRMRMCYELTFAASSLYITARYLGLAERVRRDLEDRLLLLPAGACEDMKRRIAKVRGSLQGNAGIFEEQQDAIAEVVWDPTGRVITNYEFRKRLLETPGWEQFTNLLRFFVDFGPKLHYEVANTILALGELEKGVEQLASGPS